MLKLRMLVGTTSIYGQDQGSGMKEKLKEEKRSSIQASSVHFLEKK